MITEVLSGLDQIQPYVDRLAKDFQAIDFQPFGRLEQFELAYTHAQYFATNTGPDGNAWPPLAPSTIKRKGHNKILIETGRLIQSLTEQISGGAGEAIRDVVVMHDETDIIFGTMVEYSGLHDQAVGSRPARRHVGVNDQFLDGFCDRLIRYAFNELSATP